MSTELLDRMGNLEKKIEEIGNSVTSGITFSHKGEGSFAYYEDGEDYAPIPKSELYPTQRKHLGRRGRLPKGYKKSFHSFGHFMKSLVTFTRNNNSGEFGELYNKSIDYLKKANAMSVLDSESAGSLVLPEFAPDIAAIMYDNDLIGRTDQYTIQGNRMEFPKLQESSRADGSRNGGLLGYWGEEGDQMNATRPRVGSTELKLKKLHIVVFLTEELIADNGYALEQWVRRMCQREMSYMIGDSIINGTGGGRPLGILNSPVTVAIAKESGQAAATILPANIIKMYAARRVGQPVSDLVWLINQNIEPQLFSMSMPSGHQQVVYLPPNGLAGSPNATLMGLPVLATEFNRTLGTAGDIILANLKNYLTISKGGITESVSPHVEFLRDQTALKFTFRIDGRPIYDSATTPANGTQAQSDFITLETRA
jgi:HK97 family phage major capsid protein